MNCTNVPEGLPSTTVRRVPAGWEGRPGTPAGWAGRPGTPVEQEHEEEEGRGEEGGRGKELTSREEQ